MLPTDWGGVTISGIRDWAKGTVPRLHNWLQCFSMPLCYNSVPLLLEQIGHFQTRNLQIDPGAFRQRLEDYLSNRIAVPERRPASESQRPQSKSFFWGHDHDFGD